MSRTPLLLLAVALAACVSDPEPDPGAGAITAVTSIATETSTVLLDYEGRLDDGTVFDAGQNVRFDLDQMVPGFQTGVAGMREGETKTFTVSPEEGYGAEARGPIPANATLTFEVTVHEIIDQGL